MTTARDEQLRAVARHGFSDIGTFAENIVGHPLWPHQLEMAMCPARRRAVCAGRQVGKSEEQAIEALWQSATKPGSFTLIISAGETAALRLLERIAVLASNSTLLASSVVDDTKTEITFSNGSRIKSVPASQQQIRGWSVDLLIIDEAGFVSPEIWRAAEPAIIARPGSRIILSSSPWGSIDHFFRQLWNLGMDTQDEKYASFHWPSSISPLISETDLEEIRQREAPHYFNREYMAEWTDESGAYFTTEEIENSVADYQLIRPQESRGRYTVVGGIDWGMSRDANAVVYLAASGDTELNRDKFGDTPMFFVPWLEAHHRMPYADFIDRLVDNARYFGVHRYVSETNGVGQFPTQALQDKLHKEWYGGGGSLQQLTWVNGVHTDTSRKSGGFGRIKGLLQQGRLVLPRHPDLLRQLHALTFEQTESGQFKISVPDNVGHDDLAMALLQACSSINTWDGCWPSHDGHYGTGDTLTTNNGTQIRTHPATHPQERLLQGSLKRV
ncbi:terminase large subunit domain-containing protein [Williamsia sp. DF01-3]|uniref:terminase large subunit domain-containing protein n=1 Tax=Williamsia sp. DF01-3 TaxID=2934157 RepID=UPI001FF5F4C1|nr:terminase family protein [Williamsia sp. DF01-3]MCK0516977.1 terminase family protein [Williamsia sp. DF01-3]